MAKLKRTVRHNTFAIKRSRRIDFDYDKLAKAIVKAEIEAKKQEELDKQNKQKQQNIALLKKYGYKEGSILSKVWANVRIVLFPKKEDIKGEYTTISLLQLSAETLLLIGECFLYLFCTTGLVLFFKPSIIDNSNETITRVTVVLVGTIAFVIARVLNTSRYEIEKMRDRDYINAIVGSIMTVVATIIALIEVVRG